MFPIDASDCRENRIEDATRWLQIGAELFDHSEARARDTWSRRVRKLEDNFEGCRFDGKEETWPIAVSKVFQYPPYGTGDADWHVSGFSPL